MIKTPSFFPAVVALGSNLGASCDILRRALEELAKSPQVQIKRISHFYRTKPVGYLEQNDFINAVALIETAYDPFALLDFLLLTEKKFKRQRTFKNAPRTLDLDLIDYNHQELHTEQLTLPHPEAKNRGFVLIPLAEIAPDYELLPGKRAKELIAPTAFRDVQKLSFSGILKGTNPLVDL